MIFGTFKYKQSYILEVKISIFLFSLHFIKFNLYFFLKNPNDMKETEFLY